MKIRNGFVSNSSSSSFVVIGKEMSAEEAKKEDSIFALTKVWGSEGVYAKFDISNEEIEKLENSNVYVSYYKVVQRSSDESITLDVESINEAAKNGDKLQVVSGEMDYYWDVDRVIERVESW